MKTYDDYFRAIRHVTNDDPESFTWVGIESTGLAEVMEEAENHGYSYKLECYEEMLDLKLPNGEQVEHHVRSMVFQKKLTPKEPDEFDLEDFRRYHEEVHDNDLQG